jgi:ATP-binding cassette, subfamily B, bacterial
MCYEKKVGFWEIEKIAWFREKLWYHKLYDTLSHTNHNGASMTTSNREFTTANSYAYDLRSPLRWVISHLVRYPVLPIITVVGYVIANAAYSVVSLLTGYGFDLVARPDATPAQLGGVALAILASYLLTGLAGLGGAFALETVAQRMERDSREELYINLLAKSQTFHNRQKTGDIMARATGDVQQLNLMVSPGLSLILDSLVGIIMPLAGIAFLRLDLLIVPLLFLVAFAISLQKYNNDLTPVTLAERNQFSVMNARLAETISGIEVVKAYGQEPRERGIFSDNARRFRDLFVKEGRIKSLYLPLLFYGAAYGLALGHAIILFSQGAVSVGEVVAFMGLMGVLDFPTFISVFSFSFVQRGLAGAHRLLSLIQARSDLDENVGGVARPIVGNIRFENVSAGYGDAPFLKHITFEARPGETIAIVGQTGSGKTTLTRLVNRIYDASSGRVLIDGVDVRDWSMQSLRSQISTIEQDIFLFSRTIGQNIAFGARGGVSQEQIEQAAREARAHDFIMDFPDGYDTVVGERGVTLSGGQRQRIAIARAFLTNPRILILDDSTSAIDSATEDQIQRAIRRILQGRTTLLITHRISQIRWADRILVLRRGELVDQGTHEELMEKSDDYRRIFSRYG